MKRTYIQPESKYLAVNGEAVMIGGGDEEGYGSAMGNEATPGISSPIHIGVGMRKIKRLNN